MHEWRVSGTRRWLVLEYGYKSLCKILYMCPRKSSVSLCIKIFKIIGKSIVPLYIYFLFVEKYLQIKRSHSISILYEAWRVFGETIPVLLSHRSPSSATPTSGRRLHVGSLPNTLRFHLPDCRNIFCTYSLIQNRVVTHTVPGHCKSKHPIPNYATTARGETNLFHWMMPTLAVCELFNT